MNSKKYVNKRTTKIQITKGNLVTYQGRYIEKVSTYYRVVTKIHTIGSMNKPVVVDETSYRCFTSAYKTLMNNAKPSVTTFDDSIPF